MASKTARDLSRITHSGKADVEMSKNPRSARDPEAYRFDQVLKKLETTKQHKQKTLSQNDAVDSSDGSTCDSRNDGHFEHFEHFEHFDDNQRSESRLFETRQLFVDRQLVDPMTSVDSFIEKQKSEWQSDLMGRVDNDDVLPSALLKLDWQSIPAPMHKNDVLVEIEAFTVDKRDLMIRPGVRCTGESLPQGVTTIGMDCIGRVVQLTNHARAVYGISIDDRVAAIYPFDYNIDKFRTNTKFSYALVDAGFVVAVPKHVDAADAACMIRLYLSAFQSILKGIAGVCKDRYGKDQLLGQSILVQNGHTDFGRALIELAALLGASQIFATGPTDCHPLLRGLGAIPLGAETFNWELFIEEKIGLVLVQDMPTEDNFEQYISILDETRGILVYTYYEHKHADEDMGCMGSLVEEVGCCKSSPQELTKKAQAAINSAKFSLRLACSPRYTVYEGLWHSCKESPNQFKEDLRYLFTLLGQGSLKPNVAECINLDEVAGVQDRIEHPGKKGTVVCMTTSLYEKKAFRNLSPSTILPIVSDGDDLINKYAVDAGYVKDTHACDTLSDFHFMHDHEKSFPVVQEASPCPYQTLNFSSSTTGSVKNGNFQSQQEFMNHMSLLMGSCDEDSAGNVSTANDDLQTKSPTKEDHPYLIRFHKGKSRRYKAYHQYQRQKWAEATQTKRTTEKNDEISSFASFGTKKNDDLGCSSSFGTTMYGGQCSSSSVGTTSVRKMRRESRKKEKTNGGSSANVTKMDHSSPVADTTETDTFNRHEQSNVAEKATTNNTRQAMHNKPETTKSVGEVQGNNIKSRLSNYLSQRAMATSEQQGHREARQEDNSSRGDSPSHASSFQAIRKKWEQKAI